MERTREWICKPVFRGGPSYWRKIYFRGRLRKFRDEHKEFDDFLNELNKYLKRKPNPDYKNLQLFIDGEAETNWISPDEGLFDIFIKLYNLCLSPMQAFRYIEECHEWYLFMLEAKYEISDDPNFSIRRNTWNGKNGKFIDIDVEPKQQPNDWDYHYWFHICTSLIVVEDEINDITSHVDSIELRCGHEILHDTLMLFVNHQNKPLLRNVFNTAIKDLENSGQIKEIKTDQSYGWLIHCYD